MNRATEDAPFYERESRNQRMVASASGNAVLPIALMMAYHSLIVTMIVSFRIVKGCFQRSHLVTIGSTWCQLQG